MAPGTGPLPSPRGHRHASSKSQRPGRKSSRQEKCFLRFNVSSGSQPSPSSGRCDPTPHLAPRGSHCVLEILRLRLNTVRKDREKRWS